MSSNRLGAALAVALFANQREDGGYDLDAAADSFKIAIQFRHMLGKVSKANGTRIASTIVRVCERRQFPVDSLRHRLAGSLATQVRDEVIWELRRLDPPVSYPEAGRAVGLFNHTSAIAAERRHAKRLSTPKPHPDPASAGGVQSPPHPALPALADHLRKGEG